MMELTALPRRLLCPGHRCGTVNSIGEMILEHFSEYA